MRLIGCFLIGLCVPLVAVAKDAAPSRTVAVYYTTLTAASGISANPVAEYKGTGGGTSAERITIRVDSRRRYQMMAGVGAAFSEIGTLALRSLPPEKQAMVLSALFDPKRGAGFSCCRLPVGASDFATSAYSYSEVKDDYEMKRFSLARDERSLIPAAKAARQVNPSLTFLASPWSPPGWMKESGKMDGGGPQNRLRDDDRVYRAYALYFEKYLRGYADRGVPIERLCVQNEVDMNPGYPGCVMKPPQMVKFVAQYLGPHFKSAGVPTQIWAGTFREGLGFTKWGAECLSNDSFRATVSGIAVQYFMPFAVEELRKKYPSLRMMHTEADCCNGANSAGQAAGRMNEMLGAFNAGCENYAYWNMMLDEKQSSGWGWNQNSLVTIDRKVGTVKFNPDYQPVYLASRFVKPGSRRIEAGCWGRQVAGFKLPDGSIAILVQNKQDKPATAAIECDGVSLSTELPAHADCAIVLEGDKRGTRQ
jgi:glucosylceramidase